jgi:hypothetical protein
MMNIGLLESISTKVFKVKVKFSTKHVLVFCTILIFTGGLYAEEGAEPEKEVQKKQEAAVKSKPQAAKKLYRYVDKNGRVHYSDQPQSGATEMKMETIPSIKIKTPKIDLEELVEETTKSKDRRANFYDAIGFVNFPQESVIRNNSGTVSFSVAVDPSLGTDHRIQFILDGNNLGERQSELTISANEITYGPHTISFTVVSKGGTLIQESDVINFTLLHTPRKKTGALNSNNSILNAKGLQYPNAPKLPEFPGYKLPEFPKVPTTQSEKESDT